MTEKEKREMKPVLLKFGIALAVSLGGIIFSIIRTKRIRPSASPPSPRSSGGEGAVQKRNPQALQAPSISCNGSSISPEKHEGPRVSEVAIGDSSADISPNCRFNGNKDGFLVQEFNNPVNEFDMASAKTCISPGEGVQMLASDAAMPNGRGNVKRTGYEQEIKNLRHMVEILEERERNLEIELLEYYGLKEQETAVMELQNRLKIKNMEAKLFALKIESLQADNRRLGAQVADYAKVVAELDAARAKIELLKKKLWSEAQINKEQILTIQQKVAKLQGQEANWVTSDPDVQSKLQKLNDFEEEAKNLRKSNYNLHLENSDLARRLECVQILAASGVEDEPPHVLKEESLRLRRKNEDLAAEIEQLKADRYADVEELVYLRWINACLRYELRNYQPSAGKAIARDLSKTLSPRSEEKAKQLVLEYANKEGFGEKGCGSMDFDSDQWSSSQASYLTDSGEMDDSSVDNSSATKTTTSTKTRMFSKLVKLLRGKDHRGLSLGSSGETNLSIGDVLGTCRGDFHVHDSGFSTGSVIRSRMPSQESGRESLESKKSLCLPRSKSVQLQDNNELAGLGRSCSDEGSLCATTTGPANENQTDADIFNGEKSELVKYAQVLKHSRGRKSLHQRSISHGSV